MFDSFCRAAPFPGAVYKNAPNRSSIFTMLSNLAAIQDEQWTEYAFMREPLRNRLSPEEKRKLMRKAIDCGVSEANQLIRKFGEVSPAKLADILGVKVQNSKEGTGAINRDLLAVYREPDEITIYMNGVDAAIQIFQEGTCPVSLRGVDLYGLILTHELFHVLEYRYRNRLWCCNYRMQLWSLGALRYRTGLHVLAEISAMGFAKHINQLTCLPYFAEVAVLYAKSPREGCLLFQMMMECCYGSTAKVGLVNET